MIRVCLLIAATKTLAVSAQVSESWVFLKRKLSRKFKRRPIVTTSSGQVQGNREVSGFFHTFFAFKGIPYAEPPVAELRFRNPQPHRGNLNFVQLYKWNKTTSLLKIISI